MAEGKGKKRSAFRTDKVITAVEWLCSNHKTWKKIDFDEVREAVKDWKPIIIDESETINSSNDPEHSNIEETESFSCYFPDGSVTNNSGGLDDPEEFKKIVEEAQQRGYDVEFQCDMEKSLVNDYDEDNLVNTSLLQFPYGVGGMNEMRWKGDGSKTDRLNVSEYISHLTKLSRPDFHRPLFTLMLYSIHVRQQLLKTAKLQLRGKTKAATLANGLRIEDLDNAIWFQRRNVRSGTAASRTLLDAIDSCSRSLPHTKDAAKKARSTAESMQHNFGLGSWFLTVTFDDDNSFLVQVLSQTEVDGNQPVSSLTDEELQDRAKKRTLLRLQFGYNSSPL